MAIASTNPATGEVLRRFEPHGDAEIEARLARAAQSAQRWRDSSVDQRAAVLARAAELLDRRRDELARTMTLEMGKTLKSARGEVDKCALGLRYYAEHAAAFMTAELVDGPDHRVDFEPLGVVLAVMPWNFPLWQVVRFAAPALAAGNVGLLKHSSNVPQCALALEALFTDAGAPAGVFQTLLIGGDRVAAVIADPRVAAVTVTGSEGTGRKVAAAAGQHLKKSVMELGGSDPFLVMPSADLDRAVTVAVQARCINNGQSCIAAKRFIVAEAIYDRFAPAFAAAMGKVKVGDPMDDATEVGPLATPDIVADLDDQVKRSVAAGARVLVGGKRRPGPGNFYEPTVLADAPADSPARKEELFGPVATLLRARDRAQAVALANETTFGLGAVVFTGDKGEAQALAREIASGQVFVNSPVASEPRFPFGGIKSSGYGRELGLYGLREFVNVKTVRIFGL
jgi:succinate-semialdehyde dehydrogenase/glutarate-semialdehyde dehydrogenase